MSGKRGRFLATSIFGLATAITMILAGCGSSSSGAAAAPGKGCMKVGVLLPESDTSPRWEANDHPALQAAITAALPGVSLDITNANGDATVQQTQAEADLTKGDCILVIAPKDSAASASIVEEAHRQNVPVIAYDRLINDTTLNFYVSFDGVSVGKAQGNYIQANYQKYVTAAGNNNLFMINGAPTDNNAALFKTGAHDILDPLVAAGSLKLAYEISTPNWDNPTAQTEMEGALTQNQNKVAVAYVANDGMASTVIAALKAQHLAGKVLVTGQDATVVGFQNMLLGYQAMTVYKPIPKEAQATAQLVAAISAGTDTSTIANATVAYSGTNIPSVLLPVTSVDLTNINSTVIADKYVTKADICKGIPINATTSPICS